MNIEELTKSQIILVTLLVSFVTSIATGIVTVTLMDQAPTDVTRTINRIVERTVEKVTPGETKIIERVREGGPSENELVVQAVKNSEKALVIISGDTIESRGGFIITAGGNILTSADGLEVGGKYFAKLYQETSTTTLPVVVDRLDEQKNLAYLSIVSAQSKSTDTLSLINNLTVGNAKFPYLELGKGSVSLGERVMALGFDPRLGATVELGNISALISATASSSPVIVTTIGAREYTKAMPVLDLGGTVVGVYGKDSASLQWVVYPDKSVTIASLTSNLGTSTKQTQVANVIEAGN